MARWKLETEIIIKEDIDHIGEYDIFYILDEYFSKNFASSVCNYRPRQYKGKESDFNTLLDNEIIIKATLIKEPSNLMEWWEENSVKGLYLNNHQINNYRLVSNEDGILAFIPVAWHVNRQIEALEKLIEIYRD